MEDREWSDNSFGLMPSILVASHELKSPLSLIRQYGLLLADDSLTRIEVEQIQQNIVQVSDSALGLVSDLACVANLQPSLFPLEPVHISALIQQVSGEVHPHSTCQSRRISWPSSQQSNQLIVGNRVLLGRILSNFLVNSMKYNGKDEVPIQVSAKRIGDNVRLGVRDHGPAMEPREYSRLVDELEQKKTIKSRPESSGLGVYVSSQFARAMGGAIGLTRHRDGLTFYVDMPVSNQLSLV